MELVKNTFKTSISKKEFEALRKEALEDETVKVAIRKVVEVNLQGAFPQLPNHTNIILEETDENGITEVLLKVPTKKKKVVPLNDEEIESLINVAIPEESNSEVTTTEETDSDSEENTL